MCKDKGEFADYAYGFFINTENSENFLLAKRPTYMYTGLSRSLQVNIVLHFIYFLLPSNKLPPQFNN